MLFSKIKSYSKQRHLIPSFEDGMGSIYLSLVCEATISWPQLLHHHTTTHPPPSSPWLQCPWDLPPLCLQWQILPTSTPICAGILPHGFIHSLVCVFVYPSLQLSFYHLSIHTAIHQTRGNVLFYVIAVFWMSKNRNFLRHNLRGCGDTSDWVNSGLSVSCRIPIGEKDTKT